MKTLFFAVGEENNQFVAILDKSEVMEEDNNFVCYHFLILTPYGTEKYSTQYMDLRKDVHKSFLEKCCLKDIGEAFGTLYWISIGSDKHMQIIRKLNQDEAFLLWNALATEHNEYGNDVEDEEYE